MPNNTVTYYQRAVTQYSSLGLQVIVEIDDLPAPWLELMEISRSKGPRLNQARFRMRQHNSGPAERFENIATVARPGQYIRATLICMADTASGNQISWPMFSGVISKGNAIMNAQGEKLEIIAHDALVHQDTAAIDGVRTLVNDGSVAYIRSARGIFDRDGHPNASQTALTVSGKNYHVFQLNESAASHWTFAAAICYVALEYLGPEAITDGTYDTLASMTGGQRLADVEITGLSPLSAIDRLCKRAGLDFYIAQVPGVQGRPLELLQFYRRGKGREIFLRHQVAGESLDLCRTNLAACSVESQNPSETIKAIGRGGLKRFEATFELVNAWDPTLEQDNYDLYSPATNENFIAVQDVFRKFALNEAGDYSGAPYNQGDPHDLSDVFGTSDYGHLRRRFWPCLSRTDTGQSHGYYLEISYNSGDNWWPYSGAFDVLLEECGIYISCNQFDPDMWNAIRKQALRFRVTASIDSDGPLEVELADGPVDSARPVRTVLFNLGQEFRYRKVSPSSIFHQQNNSHSGIPDTADDTELLLGALREQLCRLRRNRLAGSATLPWIHPDISPGDKITHIAGRNLDFQQMTGRQETAPQVETVKIEFGHKWSTTITFGGS